MEVRAGTTGTSQSPEARQAAPSCPSADVDFGLVEAT